MYRCLAPLLAVGLLVSTAPAEDITVATYNVEHFDSHFIGFRLGKAAATQPVNEQMKELIAEEKHQNDEDNWEVSLVITDDRFSPDILALEECCDQSDLEYFNRRWLRGLYETVIVFPSNTDRHQNVAMMLKPGFKVLDRKDKYHLEPDPAGMRGGQLFARGPSFILVQSPGGYKFWVGVTHQKSKRGVAADGEAMAIDDPNDTRSKKDKRAEDELKMNQNSATWRFREAVRTHQIMKELEKQGPTDVLLVGDMNDDIGMDEVEKTLGKDAIAELVGPEADGCVLVTQKLADAGEISFGGYYNPRYRSLIDHVIMTKSMAGQVDDVHVFKRDIAKVASDHYPVVVKFRADPVAGAPSTQPSPQAPGAANP